MLTIQDTRQSHNSPQQKSSWHRPLRKEVNKLIRYLTRKHQRALGEVTLVLMEGRKFDQIHDRFQQESQDEDPPSLGVEEFLAQNTAFPDSTSSTSPSTSVTPSSPHAPQTSPAAESDHEHSLQKTAGSTPPPTEQTSPQAPHQGSAELSPRPENFFTEEDAHAHRREVLTFSYSEDPKAPLEGDILIVPRRVFALAAEEKLTPAYALMETALHGLLHLSGLEHTYGSNDLKRVRDLHKTILTSTTLKLNWDHLHELAESI